MKITSQLALSQGAVAYDTRNSPGSGRYDRIVKLGGFVFVPLRRRSRNRKEHSC